MMPLPSDVKPSKYRYCFVVTYGRSGSTLLQGVLNAIPGYLIRGENGGMLNQMRHMVQAVERQQRAFRTIARSPSDPWYGLDLVDRAHLIADLRELFVRNFLHPPDGCRCVGFKEIRYGPDNIQDLGAYLDFIDEMFPRSCFIFNSRQVERTAISGWWSRRPDALEYLREYARRMIEVYERRRPNYFWVSYDSYVHSPAALEALFLFLDEPFDEAQVAAVMDRLHSTRTDRMAENDPSTAA